MASLNHALAMDLARFDRKALEDAEIIALFQALIDTGIAWELHPRFREAAMRLVEDGIINPGGIKNDH